MWKYNISTGELSDAKGKVVGKGYSGAGSMKNRPQSTSVVGQGPIPEGTYDICEPHTSAKTGAFVMNLFPSPLNKMYGRSAFQMHGDSIKNPGTASSGCIIMARDIRQKVWDSGDHKLEVVAS